MNYFFDISKFFLLILDKSLKTTNRLRDFNAIAAPFKTFLNEFQVFRNEINFRTQYSSETLSLQKLLNKLFDSNLERIVIRTASDIKPLYRQYNANETAVFEYSYFTNESVAHKYAYFASEFSNAYTFEVLIPSALNNEATKSKITAWVNYYRFHSKTFIIKVI
jgi:hypothetical protein